MGNKAQPGAERPWLLELNSAELAILIVAQMRQKEYWEEAVTRSPDDGGMKDHLQSASDMLTRLQKLRPRRLQLNVTEPNQGRILRRFRCEAHKDKHYSLQCIFNNGEVLWKCMAGCDNRAVAKANKQLWSEGRQLEAAPDATQEAEDHGEGVQQAIGFASCPCGSKVEFYDRETLLCWEELHADCEAAPEGVQQ